MAARAPSAIDLSLNEEDIRPRKSILAAPIDLTLDNQERLVDMPRVVLLDLFDNMATGSSSFTRMAGTYYFRGRDTMGTGTITDARIYVLSRSLSADDFSIRCTVAGSNYDLAVAGGDTSWSWRAVSTSVTMTSDETEESLDVLAKDDFGIGTVLCAGVFLATV